MGPVQFADISTAIQVLHKSMKNVIEIVFAISPLNSRLGCENLQQHLSPQS